VSLSDFARFFRPSSEAVDPDAEALGQANELLDFASTAYFPKFIGWLEAEALRPMKISKDSTDLIESAVRANTLKEIRDTLVRRVSHARAAAVQILEDNDGD